MLPGMKRRIMEGDIINADMDFCLLPVGCRQSLKSTTAAYSTLYGLSPFNVVSAIRHKE